MKKILFVVLAIFCIAPNVLEAEGVYVTGEKTFQPIMLDGQPVQIGSYLINERNYLKLRDLAALLNSTESQFNVDWDEASGNVIIETGKQYMKLDTDLIPFPEGKVTGLMGKINLLLNGELKQIETVLINENNYLQLRQVGEIAGFGVDWDETTSAILIGSKTKGLKPVDLMEQDNYIDLSKAMISDRGLDLSPSNSVRVGSLIPSFKVDMIDGSRDGIMIGQLLGDDKLKLINFFQTSCPHCTAEFPEFSKFNMINDVDVIMVSLDKDTSEVRDIFDKEKIMLPVFRAGLDNTIIRDYDLTVVPVTFFVKNGLVLGRFDGGLKESQLDFISNEINSGRAFPTIEEISKK